jgi:hypothetical protein
MLEISPMTRFIRVILFAPALEACSSAIERRL